MDGKVKLRLVPDPTFRASAPVPVPGKGSADVEFEFRWRGQKDIDELLKSKKDHGNVELLMEILVGWELDDPFNRENVERFVDHYPAAAGAITHVYVKECYGAREGN
jgi:hypothetical protein